MNDPTPVPKSRDSEDLGLIDGWKVSASLTWGYDDERNWKFGNAIELLATKDDDDRDAGIVHVRRFRLTPAMLTKLKEMVER